jgi:hypothetical protein
MSEQAFVGAGKKAGLELWRIEALKPVAQPTVSFVVWWISVERNKKALRQMQF